MNVSGRPQSSVLLCRLTTATPEQMATLQSADKGLKKEQNILWSTATDMSALSGSGACQSHAQEVENQFLACQLQERAS